MNNKEKLIYTLKFIVPYGYLVLFPLLLTWTLKLAFKKSLT